MVVSVQREIVFRRCVVFQKMCRKFIFIDVSYHHHTIHHVSVPVPLALM